MALDTIEYRNQFKRDDRELRLALLASGTVDDPADLFDEFKEVVTDDEAELDDGVDASGNAVSVKYVFDNAKLDRSREEVEQEIQAMLAAAASGTASFEEPTYSDWV